jgi:hypothetical protein
MLEESIERAFREMADQEQPHSRISIQQALGEGRTRLRRRRLTRAVGTPALAAAAVLAIVIPTTSLPTGSHSAKHQSVAPSATATSRHFSALSAYATFGRLPAKEPVVPGQRKAYAELNTWGQMEATSEILNAKAWELTAYAVGKCNRLGDHIDCGFGNGGHACGFDAYIQARAPAIDGLQAYWAYDQGSRNYPGTHCLTWEYRPGGWAYLQNAGAVIHPSKHLVVRVARGVRFGGRQPSFKFAAQFRNLPGKWRPVLPTGFSLLHSALLAGGYTIKDGKTALDIGLNFSSPKHNKCLGTKPVCRVINGYYVTVIKYPPMTEGGPPLFALWAPDADYTFVSIGLVTHKHIGLLYTMFSHLKMLGSNPADWTTRPIS